MTSALLKHRATVVASNPEMTEVGVMSPCGSCSVGCPKIRVAEPGLSVATPASGVPTAGSPVELAVSRSGLTKACALVFGLPILGWLAVTALVDAYWGETAAALVGLLTFAWMLASVRAFRSTLRRWVNIELIPL